MSLMWMPAQTTVPPLAVAASAAGTSAPSGANRIAASSGSGGAASDAPRPHGAQFARERLRGGIAGARERIHLAALVARQLRDDVRGGAEAVQPEPARVAGEAQRAVADQAGAEQRRGFGVAVLRGQGEAVARVGERVLGVAAVELIAGEARLLAQVLAAAAAVGANAAGPAQPRHADALAFAEALDARAARHHRADDLVAGDQLRLRLRQLAVDHVQIGAADRAGVHADQQLLRTRLGPRPRLRDQGGVRRVQHHGAHASVPGETCVHSRGALIHSARAGDPCPGARRPSPRRRT
uniref:Uncharacterized protein n=1 Tax=Mizugakiibacter sediminis TaxID=1475481 RepID=A0A0U1PBP6_9GAMM